MLSELCRSGLHSKGDRHAACINCDCGCHLKADEACDLIISTGGYAANWNQMMGELRIPFSRADIADEAQGLITVRLERAKR